MDYAALKTTVADWLHRKDLNARIPGFIALAESRLNAEITSRRREVVVQLDASAANATAPLPADVFELRRVRVLGDAGRVLQYAAPDQMSAQYRGGASGMPASFAVIGGSLEFGPLPDINYRVEVVYQQRIPALSDANLSNWVLADYPDAYLYGALLIAQPFVQDDQRMQAYAPMYRQAIENINSVDWYSGSTLRVRTL